MVGGVQVGAERAMDEEKGGSGNSDNRSYYDQHYGAYELYKMTNTSSYKLQVILIAASANAGINRHYEAPGKRSDWLHGEASGDQTSPIRTDASGGIVLYK